MNASVSPLYLDNNATTRPHPAVIEAMVRYEQRRAGNPASQHQVGRLARDVLEDCRERILELLGAHKGTARGDRLIFTSGATEANNLALRGLAPDRSRAIAVSAVEHPSVGECCGQLEREGRTIWRLACRPDGVVDFSGARQFPQPPQLLSLMLANHETGVLQPVPELVAMVRQFGWSTWVHTDAVQAVGKHPVHFRNLDVAAMSVSAHKFHGPTGIGALVVREGVEVQPLLFGGGQQLGKRPGTEPVSLVVGMRTALEICLADLQHRIAHMAELRDALQAGLLAADSEAVVNGEGPRLPNTLNLSWPGLDRQALLVAFDLQGVACATGSACESGSSEPSAVLHAMGYDPGRVQSALRFSVAADSTRSEIDEAVKRIVHTIQKRRAEWLARQSF